MTSKDKKELVEKKISEGDKRSYNSLMADLELQLWRERFGKNIIKKEEI